MGIKPIVSLVVFVTVVEMSLDKKNRNQVRLHIPFSYQLVLINKRDHSVTSFSTHVVIDQNLHVVDKIRGYSPDRSRQLEEKIEALLKNN